MSSKNDKPVGLVLTGGGARGAYQAGVIQGLAEIAAKRGGGLPFSIVSGASAGAVNAAFVAAAAAEFTAAAPKLAEFWSGLHAREIFRTDALSLGGIGFKWATDLLFGGMKKKKRAQSLLDTTPLRNLIASRVPFDRIWENVKSGILQAVEITATDYQTSENVSFMMAHDQRSGWALARRRTERTNLGIQHVMASSAIPLLFPAVRIGDRHYGDGCLRNPAPLGPAIRLGARRLLIIGVRHVKHTAKVETNIDVRPTIGRVMSVLLNAILMDAAEFDIERLQRYNEIIHNVPLAAHDHLEKKAIDYLYIKPSIDLGTYAAEHFDALPDIIKYLISGLGSRTEASELVSYLFFEPEYCAHLVKIGKEDALRDRDRIEALIYGP